MTTAQEIAEKTRSRARSLVQGFGYDVHKLRDEPTAQLMEVAASSAVIGVGANTGQFASWVRDTGFEGEIISFEPQPEEHAALVSAAETDPARTIAPRCAPGAANGTAQIHVAGNSLSSSLLEMLDLHSANATMSAYADSIDTQGSEAEVLGGATTTLPKIAADHAELSLAPLYDGQALASEIFALFGAAGLELTAVNEYFNTGDCQIAQTDGGFTRMGERKKPA
jgi:FkbM family methyltransferase